jgi:hypothetical protein
VPARVLATLDRLYGQNPDAMAAFFAWLDAPGHTKIVSLHFQQGRLQYVRREETAK